MGGKSVQVGIQTKTRTGSHWTKSETWAESMMVYIYDQMVYKLYGLTAEEIVIVEESVGRK